MNAKVIDELESVLIIGCSQAHLKAIREAMNKLVGADSTRTLSMTLPALVQVLEDDPSESLQVILSVGDDEWEIDDPMIRDHFERERAARREETRAELRKANKENF